MAKLIVTTSYFNTFPLLIEELKPTSGYIDAKRLVFCEEKISLMTERAICSAFGGSFNTEAYSFGNYMRVKKQIKNLLSKEGSAMVVKRILSQIELKCFNRSKADSASVFYELIAQLKSSAVTPDDLLNATQGLNGVLKNKIKDVATVYKAYEEYIREQGFEDQSSAFSYLPEIIKNDKELENAQVYVFGLTSITQNAKEVIKELLLKAKSVTAVFTGGENPYLYLNEVEKVFANLCEEVNVPLIIERKDEGLSVEGKIIVENLFSPSAITVKKTDTDKIRLFSAGSIYEETEKVARIIKETVMKGEGRYRDFTVAVPDVELYSRPILEAFASFDVPCFLDQKKKPLNHPLIILTLSLLDILAKGAERELVTGLVKNPLFSDNKRLNDKFENYLIKHNVNYSGFFKPFTFACETPEELQNCEELRIKLCSLLNDKKPSSVLSYVYNAYETLKVEEGLKIYSERLEALGEREEKAINDQIYKTVFSVLEQIEIILKGVEISPNEFKKIFLSGVSALELSIIPQYNDAVFIGGYKEAGLLKAKCLFAMGLTSGVPAYSEDTALLSDNDIDLLDGLKVKVEPKIKIVNKRVKEGVGLAISAFRERLFLSYPYADGNGKKTGKNEIVSFIEKAFTCQDFPKTEKVLHKKQGLKYFATECGKVSDGSQVSTEDLSTFYWAVKEEEKGKVCKITRDDYYTRDCLSDDLEYILEQNNKEEKIRLENNSELLVKDLASPTAIENYFKCPYKSFLENGLGIRERETGEIDGLKVGVIMHEIFASFAQGLNKVYNKESSDALFDGIVEELLKKQENKRFSESVDTDYAFKSVISECKKLCYNVYMQLSLSEFKPDTANLEVKFGDGKGAIYPAVPLLDGKVKLSGVIDRIDTYNGYCRIIDYKTGKIELSDANLFTGIKLQLFLYASSVRDSKQLAGVYYLKASDEYVGADKKVKAMMQGKTLDEEDIVRAQDLSLKEKKESDYIGVKINSDGSLRKGTGLSSEEFNDYIDYAVKVSEKAVKQLSDGVIVASPYKDTCTYCKYLSVCKKYDAQTRTVKKVEKETIVEAVQGERTDA